MEDKIILYNEKKDCCGCGACMNICPNGAISMVHDDAGFIFPQINNELCIKCGACLKSCGYKNQNNYENTDDQNVFAFASKDREILIHSASGGAFAEIAKAVLEQEQGVVYGAVSESRDKEWKVHHLRVDDISKLECLQGSKYVQSEMGYIYSDIKADLIDGKKVLFSGTPCQVDGLRSYLKKQYDNLLTVDIICHGVPNQRLFSDFLKSQELKRRRQIDRFVFRDKSKGQGMISRMDMLGKSGASIVKKGELYSYFYLFIKQHIYRENCYSCPYARRERVSDLTLGDFWGFAKLYPNVDKEMLSDERGVSCILSNTNKGLDVINKLKATCVIIDSDFEKASAYNGQLTAPSKHSGIREEIINKYSQNGYEVIENYYKTHFLKDRVKYNISAIIPMDIKRKVRALIRR